MGSTNGNGGNNVRVEIYDQTYHLRGSDPEYISELAEYVDTKMRLIAQQASTVDSLRVAVLAALNIADDMFKSRDGREPQLTGEEISSVAQRLLDRMDDDLLQHTPLEEEHTP